MNSKLTENKHLQSKNRTTSQFNATSYRNERSLQETKKFPEDIREQLRIALEELEHHKLTSELEQQKRILLEQQLKSAKQEIQDQKIENEQIKKQLTKINKKYNKLKQNKECQKCKNVDDLQLQLEKEREIYNNDRAILRDQIKNLKLQLQNSEKLQDREQLLLLIQSLKKQIYYSSKKGEQDSRIINFMNEKLSLYEMENLQIMKNVELLENKLSEVQIENIMFKKSSKYCQNCKGKRVQNLRQNSSNSALSVSKRKNGSIKNGHNRNYYNEHQKDHQYPEELERYSP